MEATTSSISKCTHKTKFVCIMTNHDKCRKIYINKNGCYHLEIVLKAS